MGHDRTSQPSSQPARKSRKTTSQSKAKPIKPDDQASVPTTAAGAEPRLKPRDPPWFLEAPDDEVDEDEKDDEDDLQSDVAEVEEQDDDEEDESDDEEDVEDDEDESEDADDQNDDEADDEVAYKEEYGKGKYDPNALRTDADRFNDYVERLKERRDNTSTIGLPGVTTGLPQLDEATGGLQEITIIGGHTGTGKTSLASQFCLEALKSDPDLAVVYFLLDEMAADELFDQLVCHVAKVDHEKYVGNKLSADERKKVDQATEWLRKHIWPRMVTVKHPPDPQFQGLTAGRIVTHYTNKLMARTGARRMMVVIDMFEDMPIPQIDFDYYYPDFPPVEFANNIRKIQADPHQWQLQEILNLREQFLRLDPGGCPILVLAKLRKSAPRYQEPEIEDLLGAANLGYKAKRVIFLVPQATDAKSGVAQMTLVVKKARHASQLRLPLRFHYRQFRFEEATPKTGANKGSTRTSQPTAKASVVPPSTPIDPLAGMEP